MNLDNWKLAENFLPKTYVQQAQDASKTRESLIRQLLHHKKIPEKGWDEQTIELFLNQLASMDSNNFPSNCGVGEREARFASDIVARRHYRLGHGVGRSGDLAEVQPKAAGSSLISKLTNCMIVDLLHFMGIKEEVHCLLAPVATGMSIVLTLLTLKSQRPNAQYVIWSRIDQKSCFKSIVTAGLKPIVIDTLLNMNDLITNEKLIEEKIAEIGENNVVCIMTTTSCFAPRSCDSIVAIARLCKKMSIPHVINNAYGLQSEFCMNEIQKAKSAGRLDIFVQSTDKNLMVPIGGTIIAGFDKQLIENISKSYPGRASLTPTLDVFITLLNIGKEGYKSFVNKRKEMYIYLCEKLSTVAEIHNEQMLCIVGNPISIGMTLSKLAENQLTQLGSMLFLKHVSGARVVTTTETKTISGIDFKGWGSHCANYPTPYLTCASSIGMRRNDVDLFIKKLDKVLFKLKRNSIHPNINS